MIFNRLVRVAADRPAVVDGFFQFHDGIPRLSINPELLAGDYLRKAVILLLTAKSAGRLKMPIDAGQKSGLTNLATGDINFSEPFLSCRSPLCENTPTAT